MIIQLKAAAGQVYGLRWGGTFTEKVSVLIDDNYWHRNNDLWNARFNEIQNNCGAGPSITTTTIPIQTIQPPTVEPLTDLIDQSLTTCSGTRSIEKIIGGVGLLDEHGSAQQAGWPWMVRLYFFDGTGNSWKCGGSIVHENWVLSGNVKNFNEKLK